MNVIRTAAVALAVALTFSSCAGAESPSDTTALHSDQRAISHQPPSVRPVAPEPIRSAIDPITQRSARHSAERWRRRAWWRGRRSWRTPAAVAVRQGGYQLRRSGGPHWGNGTEHAHHLAVRSGRIPAPPRRFGRGSSLAAAEAGGGKRSGVRRRSSDRVGVVRAVRTPSWTKRSPRLCADWARCGRLDSHDRARDRPRRPFGIGQVAAG